MTTTVRIDALLRSEFPRRRRAAKLLGITEPSVRPITYLCILDKLGLDDALWCGQAEPDLAPVWRKYAVWCAKQVQHLISDQRVLDALDVAERHSCNQASYEEYDEEAKLDAEFELAVALAATRDAALAAARAAEQDGEQDGALAFALGAALAATRDNAWAGALAAALDAKWASAWDAADGEKPAAWDAARRQQDAAFRQLITTGSLP